MPELPEVEVTRLGLLKKIKQQRCQGVIIRETRFRKPLRSDLGTLLKDKILLDIQRRGKYLIWEFDNGALLSHLGMSGVMRVFEASQRAPQKHDHVDLLFGAWTVRFHDPRRFGFIEWYPSAKAISEAPEIKKLGVEPLSASFNAKTFKSSLIHCSQNIKSALLSGRFVVGVGNIYCSEALFKAKINPATRANSLSVHRLETLIKSIQEVLKEAIQQGGSTLKDFVSAEGNKGYFTINAFVYGREGESCRVCGHKIKRIIQGQRSTFFCPYCQAR